MKYDLPADWKIGYAIPVKFEWNRHKNKTNIKKHGLDFADAHKVFQSPMPIKLDDREEYEKAYKDEFGTF